MKIRSSYLKILSTAFDEQVRYSMNLRRSAVSPLLQLIDAQSQLQDTQMAQLRRQEKKLKHIESDLNALGKRKILGIRI